ncbi:hypothetical protein HNR67_005789 [Crossiella cryophila]|uniref:Uncharacterized protein n=1 Tax=Crossiella cryophila TaxID=43355 RepID=A0A7W7FUS9_9PSEU|nr:hypothetical protein [Crossiella cryophila]
MIRTVAEADEVAEEVTRSGGAEFLSQLGYAPKAAPGCGQ